MKKYIKCFLMGISKATEYRFDFFSSYFGAIFPILIQVSMWKAIYETTGGGILYGYTYHQMLLYTFFVGVTAKFLSTGFEWEMNDDIKNGGLNKYIVKPINYCYYRGACFFGERFSLSIIFLIILTVISVIFGMLGYFKIDVIRIIYFITAIVFSLILNFTFFFIVGLSGLWLTEISRIFPAISVIIMVMSGGIFPLDILGEHFNKVILFLPVKYMLQFPVEIITGKEMTIPIYFSFAVQIFWIVFLGSLASIMWKKGLKKYVAVGG